MKKAYIKRITIKRWFDKINWNSYFNFQLLDNNNNIIESENSLYYGYWTSLFSITWYLQDEFKRRKINLSKNCELIDLWYWLKRELQF